MEERRAWPLSTLATGEYGFDSNQIQRMELLVLTTLNWRMHYITPFHFIHCFISCFFVEELNSSTKKQYISLVTQMLLAATKGKLTYLYFICFYIFINKYEIITLVELMCIFFYLLNVDTNIMRHRSSTIAMAATLRVIDQNLTKESLEIKLKNTWLYLLFNHVSDCSFYFGYYS